MNPIPSNFGPSARETGADDSGSNIRLINNELPLGGTSKCRLLLVGDKVMHSYNPERRCPVLVAHVCRYKKTSQAGNPGNKPNSRLVGSSFS